LSERRVRPKTSTIRRRSDRAEEVGMDERRIAGNTTAGLALVLLVLVGVGAWNYHRNWTLERASERGRPYAGYSARDVELLRDAVAGELDQKRAVLARAKRGRVGSARDKGAIADNVRQFDRASRAGDAIRDAAGDVAEREQLKAALDHELEVRAGAGTSMALHLARLTRF